MDPARARQLLERERKRIEQAIAGLDRADPEASGSPTEPGERGSEELFQKELDEGLTEDLAEQLGAVERAERRLAEGTFGLSIESGRPIPDDRLEALPTAERTIDEQQALGPG
jgi:DnaK suppressor protein